MKKQTSTKKPKTKEANAMPAVRSKFYVFDRRAPVISGRVVGLNLQGHAQPKKAFFFSLSKEVKTTIFMLELSIANVRWTVSKSFEELRQFYALLRTDETLYRGRDLLTTHFPAGEDGEDDVMLLVERREMIEAFVRETLQQIDPEVYAPLALFIDSPPHVDYVRQQLRKIVKFLRSLPSKKKLFLRLFEVYSKELMDFVCRLEHGVEVFNIDDRYAGGAEAGDDDGAAKVASVLWLDPCEEPGLSRLCLAPRAVFDLPAIDVYEDARLANGVFLSDIAEVRKGAASEPFRRQSFAFFQRAAWRDAQSSPATAAAVDGGGDWYDAAACVSVIGAERTLAFELAPPAPDDTDGDAVTRSNTRRNAGAAAAAPPTLAAQRAEFVELLSLLALQSLSAADLATRRCRFRKWRVHPSLRPGGATACGASSPASPLDSPLFRATHRIDAAAMSRAAAQTEALLLAGLDVEEEVVSPLLGAQVVARRLRYDPRRRCLWLTTPAHSDEAAARQQRRLDAEFDFWHRADGDADDASDASGASDDDGDEAGGYEDDAEGDAVSRHLRHLQQLHAPHAPSSPLAAAALQQQQAFHHQQAQLAGAASRFLFVDDVAEVRPGRVSSFVDHPEHDGCVLSIIGSASIVVLPVPSVALRDKLVARFQAFFWTTARQRSDDDDAPAIFQPRHFAQRHRRRLQRDWRAAAVAAGNAPPSGSASRSPSRDADEPFELRTPSGAAPFTPLARVSDAALPLGATAERRPSLSSHAARHAHHRRHSHDAAALGATPLPPYLTPPPGSAGLGVSPVFVSPLLPGAATHLGSRPVSRAVSTVRRSSSSTKGKSSLSEAFSFS